MATARANRPAPASSPARISTNLDELEKENPLDPFVVVVGGREITFTDVRDLPWDVLANVEADPDEFMWETLSKEDYDYFKAQKVPGWKIDVLIKDYRAHFGIGTRGNGRGSRS